MDNYNLNQELFSTTGRLNRSRYIVNYLFCLIISYIVSFVMSSASRNIYSRFELFAFFIYFIFLIVLTFIIIVQSIKRLHDLDRPGVHVLLLLIPIYNIYISLILFLKRGTRGTNKFGEDILLTAKPFQEYCPKCHHFEASSGVCYKLHENVSSYPMKFVYYCNGKLFTTNKA